MEETVRSGCVHGWKNAKDKRKAWARSRDSWQNSEGNDNCLVTETMEDNSPSNLELSRTSTGEDGISNKKIEIWLQDCGGPLGVSLDEQSHLFKGAVSKNGCSFEDDLTLGAEANYLHPHSSSMLTPSGTPVKVKRNQFYQMGNSMNSTGSGKSNTTVSSVSELLDLYEEDPEDVLYNLGFGTEEPDLASKIPCRFFNASSFAKGIDFKLFLDAQMQRMELDNPNFALTSRFRQIKVLTTVANVFSSLYSQVSGAPIKRIGSVSEAPTAGQGNNTVGNNTGRLKKTVSKLNLFGAQQIKAIDTASQTVPADTENSKALQHSFDTNKGITDTEKKEEANQKKETKLQKWRKLTDPSLKSVTEEVMTGHECAFYPSEFIPLVPASNVTNDCVESKHNDAPYNKERSENRLDDISDVSDSDRDLNAFTEVKYPASSEQTFASSQENVEIECTPPVCSTPEKGLSAAMQHPLISSLMEQKEFSFDLEEVQSNEGEGPNVPATRNPVPPDRISAINKEHFTRTSSSHSDSSGFAEDPSSDMTGHSQGPDGYLQAMGSSVDSCDSETTVTSLMDDLKTPLSGDQKFFTPFQTPVEDLTLDVKETMLDLNVELISNTAIDSSEQQGTVEKDCESGTGQLDGSIQSADQTAFGLIDGEVKLYPESELKCESEEDIPTYSRHCGLGQRRKSIDSILSWHSRPDNATSRAMDFSSSSIDKVTTVLKRAKTQTYCISITSGKSRRPMTKANDRIMREGEMASKNGSTAELKRSSFQRSSSLPSKLLNPVRVVSSLNVQLTPDSNTEGSSPSFAYRYSVQKEGEFPSDDENEQSVCRSMLFIPSGGKERSRKRLTLNAQEEAPPRFGSQPIPVPSHLTQSCCSLHTLPSDLQDQPLYGHLRTRSMCSIPNVMEPTYASTFGYAYPQRRTAQPYRHSPINPPSAIESQLRRVLTEIRSTVQNLSRIPMFQGTELSFPYYPSARCGLLPIYESTYQELQIMRRNLNFFRTQMMDLEFMLMRQQTIFYRHLTDEERQEADQLQNLRNCVRMELQELELQLEERSFALEDQLKAPSHCSAFRMPSRAETFANNTDAMSSSSLNVTEPVSELLREQSYLRSELGFSEHLGEDDDYPHSYCGPYTNLESCSRSSSPGWTSRCSAPGSLSHGPQSIPSTTAPHGKPMNQATSSPLQSRQVYRSSVLLTPSLPARAAQGESFTENKSPSGILDQNPISQTSEPPEAEEVSPSKGARSHIVEHPAFHDVLQEIKESIVGEIKREIMDGLLAAISPSGKDVAHKEE